MLTDFNLILLSVYRIRVTYISSELKIRTMLLLNTKIKFLKRFQLFQRFNHIELS